MGDFYFLRSILLLAIAWSHSHLHQTILKLELVLLPSCFHCCCFRQGLIAYSPGCSQKQDRSSFLYLLNSETCRGVSPCLSVPKRQGLTLQFRLASNSQSPCLGLPRTRDSILLGTYLKTEFLGHVLKYLLF